MDGEPAILVVDEHEVSQQDREARTILFAAPSGASLLTQLPDIILVLSGQEVMQTLESRTVDCIVLDESLPGISAADICRAIRNRACWRRIPILLLTDAGDVDTRIEGLHAGADDCIPKSSDPALLQARVEALLRQASRADLVGDLENRNRELEAFAHSVSHDLRAPLRSIREFNQAFLDDFSDNLPLGAREYLERVQAAANRMGKLIDSLLEMSRTSRVVLRREPVDFSAVARSVAQDLSDHRSYTNGPAVELLVQEGLLANADASLVRVILQNLLSNAWKFTSKTLRGQVVVGGIERDGCTVFYVRDNGAGFDAAHAERLFLPFERMHSATDFPGTGIGLATVRRIVERHRGEIWVESAVGRGATFFFTLGPN